MCVTQDLVAFKFVDSVSEIENYFLLHLQTLLKLAQVGSARAQR